MKINFDNYNYLFIILLMSTAVRLQLHCNMWVPVCINLNK